MSRKAKQRQVARKATASRRPTPEPVAAGTTSAEAAPEGAAKVATAAAEQPKSRREASIPQDSVTIAKAGSGVEPGAPPAPTAAQAPAVPPESTSPDDEALCYIVMPKRVRFGDAVRWAAFHQRRFSTAVELVSADGKQVLQRYDNSDREDRHAPSVPLAFAWHPDWDPPYVPDPTPKPPKTVDEDKPAKARPPGGAHRKGTGPAGRVLELCLRDAGASSAELREIGNYCDGRTYLQRLENVHGLTLEKLPNGNFKFSRKEAET